MKLAVSNIAWENEHLQEHLSLLRDLGCDGVELALSCIWKEPVTVNSLEVAALKKMIASYGLTIPALHALLFTRPDLQLFEGEPLRQKTIEYLKEYIRLAKELNARVIVYGSPKSRLMGKNDYPKCYATAVEVFKELGQEAQKSGIIFCIEPLGPAECDFIRNANEGADLVKDVGNPNFGLHLDAKAMIDAKEDFDEVFKSYSKIIRHFHIGDPGLAPPGYTGFDHSRIGKPLSENGYDGFLSIEMKRGFGESKEVIKKAVEYVRKNYFINSA